MAKNYIFNNNASKDNIPKKFEGIIKDTIIMYTSTFPKDKLVCVFAQGSMTRGNFRPKVSDFDTVVILRDEPTKAERDTFKNNRLLLEAKYAKMGIKKIDGDLMNLQRFLSSEKLKSRFILATDGLCIFGKVPDFEKIWPNPGNELSQLLNHRFAKNLELYRNYQKGAKITRPGISVESWLAKEALRLLFGITMEQSGEYTAKIDDYQNHIERYLAEELSCFDHLYTIYEGAEIHGDTLLTYCEHVLSLAQARGAIAP